MGAPMRQAGLCTYVPVALAGVTPDVPVDVLAARGTVYTETHGDGESGLAPVQFPSAHPFGAHPAAAAPSSTRERNGDKTGVDGDRQQCQGGGHQSGDH